MGHKQSAAHKSNRATKHIDQETGETDPESIDNLLRTGFRC